MEKTSILFLIILLIYSGGINPKWIFPETEDVGVNGLDVSFSEKYVVAGIKDTLYVLNISDGKPLWMLKIGSSITSLDLSGNGRFLAIATSNKSIMFIDIIMKKILWKYCLNLTPVSIKVSRDGSTISIITRKKLCLFKNSSKPEYVYEFDENPNILKSSVNCGEIVVSTRNIVYMFNDISGKPIRILKINCVVNDIDVSGNGRYVSIVLSNYTLILMDRNLNQLWRNVLDDMPRLVSITRDESKVIVATNQFIYAYSIENGSCIYKSTFLRGRPKHISVSYNGEIIVVGGYAYIYFFSIKNRFPIYAYSLCTCSFPYNFNQIIVSDNGQYVVAGTDGEKLYLFQLKFKKSSSIKLYYNFTDIAVGDTITIKGVLNPNLARKYVNVVMFRDGETNIVGIVKTNETGGFTFKLKILYRDFILRFVWEGDREYFGCASEDIHIHAKEYTMLKLNISSNRVVLGDSLNIYGKLLSKNGTPIGNAEIYVNVILPDNSTERFNIYTNSSGVFSLKYVPKNKGKYTVYAFWNGSIDYKPAKSSLKTFIVEVKSMDYIIIIITIIVVAIILSSIYLKSKIGRSH